MADRDIVSEAMEAFELARDAESENRDRSLEDTRFGRLNEHWPEKIRKDRESDGRPCLTIPKLPIYARQVINDARQNRPAINTSPVDSEADVETSKIYDGLIRNIEHVSNADTAYDTAVENAVYGGIGYLKADIDHAHDDTFDKDIIIKRVANPFSIYGDPFSDEADSSDWNSAFELSPIPLKVFEKRYKGADAVDWEGDYGHLDSEWFVKDETVTVASWWRREEIDRIILKLSDGTIVDESRMEELAGFFAEQGLTVEGQRPVKSWRVYQCLLTGAEKLEEIDWPGRYIPIVPVYGEEFNVQGERYWRSLIHNAKDAQRQFNYWRTAGTELVALAPRVPFIGPVGAFDSDAEKWGTINTKSWAHVEYDGNIPPQRQPLDSGVAAGAMQEALNSNDDIKSSLGMFDASLGAQSNETSGKAIIARQREGDVATFHFIDNLSRGIRHLGRIIIDLIPHVYNEPRIIRVMGEDRKTTNAVQINKEVPVTDEDGNPVMQTDENGEPVTDDMGKPIPMTRIYDLSIGKYDLAVNAGPSFTTKREEAATQMMQLIQAFPQSAAYIGDLVAKNLDWPGADEIAERLQKMLPENLQEGQDIPPELLQTIEQGQQLIQQLQSENEQLKNDKQLELAKNQLERMKTIAGDRKARYDAQKEAMQSKASADVSVSKDNLERRKIDLQNRELELEERRLELEEQQYNQTRADSGIAEQPAAAELLKAVTEQHQQIAAAVAPLTELIGGVAQQVDGIKAYLEAPAKIVRNGGETFVEKGGLTRRVIKGADGRAAGLQ